LSATHPTLCPYMDRLTGNWYSSSMSTQHRTAPSPESVQLARARYLDDALRDERWSRRQLAMRTGLSKGVVNSRLNGETPLNVDEITIFAKILRRDPVELFATLMSIRDENGPASEEAGPNVGTVHPLGLEPRTHWVTVETAMRRSRPSNRTQRNRHPRSRAR
jgi:transcriptional regulator with XRE-family HTH domain